MCHYEVEYLPLAWWGDIRNSPNRRGTMPDDQMKREVIEEVVTWLRRLPGPDLNHMFEGVPQNMLGHYMASYILREFEGPREALALATEDRIDYIVKLLDEAGHTVSTDLVRAILTASVGWAARPWWHGRVSANGR